MLSVKEFNAQLQIGTNLHDGSPMYDYNKETRSKMYKAYKMNCDDCLKPSAYCTTATTTFELASSPCYTVSMPCAKQGRMTVQECVDRYIPKQEGTTPMRYNDNYASANASIAAPKSDAASQREYFLNRLNRAECPKRDSFSALFNMNVNTAPRSFVELIDWIKKDKFSINKKIQKRFDLATEDVDAEELGWYYGPMYGIEWEGPKADATGYNAALEEMDRQQTIARDTIMSGDAAAMKAAVEAFEAWTPTATTPTN